MIADGAGVWVYAIGPADSAADRTTGLRGVAEEPVRTVRGGDLAAAVGTVSLDEFGAAGKCHAEDRDVLAERAKAHNAVVSAIGRAVVPVRMATIYRDDWRVCQLLLKEHHDIEMALRRVSGRQEIGVTASVDPKKLATQGDLIQSESTDALSRAAHLFRRRRQLASQQQGYRLAAAEADRVHAVLMRCAVDGKRTPPSDQNPVGNDPWTVFNGTYLVDEDGVAEFMESIAALERSTARITLDVTGPCPPYSFAGDLVAM
jgi:Gas vesicle synthesis protein GvpL/GvpF